VDRQNGVDGFDFEHDLTRDDDIRLKAVTDRYTFVDDGNRNLRCEGNLCLRQFVAQALLLNGLQQPGTGAAVHLDCEADHTFGQWLRQQHNPAP
jgi:hypothetical protein